MAADNAIICSMIIVGNFVLFYRSAFLSKIMLGYFVCMNTSTCSCPWDWFHLVLLQFSQCAIFQPVIRFKFISSVFRRVWSCTTILPSLNTRQGIVWNSLDSLFITKLSSVVNGSYLSFVCVLKPTSVTVPHPILHVFDHNMLSRALKTTMESKEYM